MDYKEQYQRPEWQKKRLEILKRDDFTCTACGNKEEQLHVHHLYYLKNKKVWEYRNSELTTLCKNCHESLTTMINGTVILLRGMCKTRDITEAMGLILFYLKDFSLDDLCKMGSELFDANKENKEANNG